MPWYLHDKLKAHEFFKYAGLPTAEIYRNFSSADSIDLDGLPDEFVLKPTFLFSAIGVMVLARSEKGFYDSMSDKEYTADQIRAFQQQMSLKSKSASKPYIVEERIREPDGRAVPRDIKFFGFQGEIVFIEQVGNSSGKPTHAWFDGDFNPLTQDDIFSDPKYFEIVQPERPANWEQQLNMARRASIAVPAPFARIDTYSSTRGPLLGEVTLVPGVMALEGYVTPSERIEWLAGHAWEKAARRLL